MAVGDTAPSGAPIWIDLATSDVARAQEFYGAVFGWTFESAGPEYEGYVNAFSQGRPVAGLMRNDPHGTPPTAGPPTRTTDIKTTVDKATAVGAAACMEPMGVKDKGWMGMLTDQAGAVFGLWQPTGHRGFEVVGEAGAPVYFQLTTRATTPARWSSTGTP